MPGEQTIDFGIDLGTTNSAIAVFDNGQSTIIKSSTSSSQSDLTPSCVSISSDGEWVGQAARGRLMASLAGLNETFMEFKRAMGTNTTYLAPGGRQWTPTELSARVLSSLRQDAAELTGAAPTSVVVTVPAAFDIAQISATQAAGQLAGFEHVETLQEPIAAALAYGFDRGGDGYYLAFDFGGGTFDAALLHCDHGVITVVKHRGDNNLGAGRWDGYIVDTLLTPMLAARGFTLSRARDRSSSTFWRLKDAAEKARIELSRRDRATLLFHAELRDDSGRSLPEDLQISAAELESLIAPDLERAKQLALDALAESRISASQLTKVILVGGPTRTPLLRRTVESLGAEIATMVDPMTVVARGAAIYARSRPRKVSAVTAAAAPAQSVVLQLVYEAMVEPGRTEVYVGIRVERQSTAAPATAVRLVSADGAWDSGMVKLEDGQAFISARLIAPGAVEFRVLAESALGPLAPIPGRFLIERGVSGAPPPVNHRLSLAVDASSQGSRLLEVVSRGERLPVSNEVTVWTTRAVSPRDVSQAGPVRLLILEGDGTVPERNTIVGELFIAANQVERALPANSEVKLRIKWEPGQDPTASAYVQYLDQHFSGVLKILGKAAPSLEDIETALEKALENLDGIAAPDDPRLRKIAEIRTQLREAQRGDIASGHAAANEIGPLLDASEARTPEQKRAQVRARVERNSAWARRQANVHLSDEEKGAVALLIKEAEQAAQYDNAEDLDHRIRRLVNSTYEMLVLREDFIRQEFSELVSRGPGRSDPDAFGRLVERGRRAIEQKDLPALRDIVDALWGVQQSTEVSRYRNLGVRLAK